jgi:CarD family transcriptional regulator
VGEKIVYPNHGVSVVEKIGEGFQTEPVAPRSFYHLRLLSNNSRVMVPVGNTGLIGLRRLTQRKDITGLMKTLGAGRFSATGDWKGRYKQNLDKMKSGELHGSRTSRRPELHLVAQDAVLPEKRCTSGPSTHIVSEIADQRPRRERGQRQDRAGAIGGSRVTTH